MENQNQSTEVAVTATKDKQELMTKETSSIASKLSQMFQEFVESNKNMGLDYVNVGAWIRWDKKGIFYVKDTEEKLGDECECVMIAGKERFVLWGAKGTAYNGQILISADTREEAEEAFDNLADEILDSHSRDKIQARYLATIITRKSIEADNPEIFNLSFPPSAKYAFGHWSHSLFMGRGDGIPPKTPVSHVYCIISTVTRKVKNSTDEYITLEFRSNGLVG